MQKALDGEERFNRWGEHSTAPGRNAALAAAALCTSSAILQRPPL